MSALRTLAVGCIWFGNLSCVRHQRQAVAASERRDIRHDAVSATVRTDETTRSMLLRHVPDRTLHNRVLIARYLCVGQAIPQSIVEQELRRTSRIVQPIGPSGVFWARFGDRCWSAELLDAELSRTVSLQLTSPGITEHIVIGNPDYEFALSYRHRFVATDASEAEQRNNSVREFQLPSDEKPHEDSPWIRCAFSGFHRYQTFPDQRQCESAIGLASP